MVMKRGSDIASPTRNKRTRGGLDVLHTVNIGRFSSESDRRARGLSLEARTFNPKRERNSHIQIIKSDFGADSFKGKRTGRDDEASIRVTNFTRGAADHVLREKLNYEFKKFGEITVRIMRHGDERYAVVYFRNSDDAVEAKRSIENRGRAIFMQDRALNLQFSIPGGRNARRFTPDMLEQERSFSRGSPRSKLQNDVLDIANEGNFDRRNRKGERFYSGQATASATLVAEEEDPKATRTLFVGNLESSISRQDVRREFEQFGIVEDVDIKRPIRGQGSTYAFVKFIDLDVATKAKVAMQGSLFGRNRVKIGYGKSMPTTRLWIGGLGSWTSIVELEREFDRFGAIRRIDYNKGHDHAFILYDSLDAASVASREMRGFELNGGRIKIDFADLTQGLEEYPDTLGHLTEDRENQCTSSQIQDDLGSTKSFNKSPEKKGFVHKRNNSEGSGNRSFKDQKPSSGKYDGWTWLDEKEDTGKQKSDEKPKFHGPRTPSPPSENQNVTARNHRSKDIAKSREKHKSGNGVSHSRSPPAKRPRKTSGPAPALSPQRFGSVSPKRKSHSSSPVSERNHKSDKEHKEKDREKDKNKDREKKERTQENKNVESDKPASGSKEIVPSEEPVSGGSESLQDIAKRFAVAWRGSLILKNSSFPVRLHLIGGNPEVVEVLLRSIPGNSAPNTVLRISQRLRLDQPKLEEVSKRMNTAGASGYCMLLALPGIQGGEPPLDTETSMPTQQRPLRNLVTYLKQKQAAGVVNLINTSNLSPTSIKDEGGVLHAFPPCQYSHDQLLKIAPHLGQEAFKEDHLVVVVIRGPA